MNFALLNERTYCTFITAMNGIFTGIITQTFSIFYYISLHN